MLRIPGRFPHLSARQKVTIATACLTVIGLALLASERARQILSIRLDAAINTPGQSGSTLDASVSRRRFTFLGAELTVTKPQYHRADGMTFAADHARLSLNWLHPRRIMVTAYHLAAVIPQSGTKLAITSPWATATVARDDGLLHGGLMTDEMTISVGASLPRTIDVHHLSGTYVFRPITRPGDTRLGLSVSAARILPDPGDWPAIRQWGGSLPGWPPHNVHAAVAWISPTATAQETILVHNLSGTLGPLGFKATGKLVAPSLDGSLTVHLAGLRQTAHLYLDRRLPDASSETAPTLARLLDSARHNIERLPDQADLPLHLHQGEPDIDLPLWRRLLTAEGLIRHDAPSK